MLTSFWQAVGGRLADRWAAMAGPALVFWLAGVVGLALQRGMGRTVDAASTWLSSHSTTAAVGVLLAALAVVTGSSVLVDRLTEPLTRLLEGYGWPRWLGWWRRWLVERNRLRRKAAGDRYQQCLADQETATGDRVDELAAEQVTLEIALRRFPADPDVERAGRLMPTRLGNILRAAEGLPDDKYGLDAVICWPRLWMALPGDVRDELARARNRLDSSVSACAWAVLFVFFTPWVPWAPGITVAVAAAAYYVWVLNRSRLFGDLIESTFDLYRHLLYQALRWPLPANPADERGAGKALTNYLWRGSDAPEPKFVEPP